MAKGSALPAAAPRQRKGTNVKLRVALLCSCHGIQGALEEEGPDADL